MSFVKYAADTDASNGLPSISAVHSSSVDLLSQRIEQLLGHELSFVYNDEFESLGEAAINELANRPTNYLSADEANTKTARSRSLNRMNLSQQQRLSVQGEVALFRQYNFLKYRANALRSSLDPNNPDEAAVRRIDRLVRQANRVRERLITANLRLGISIARRFAESRTPIDELISEANLVLVNAVEKFDYSRGFRFSTYATHAVQRHLFRYSAKRQRQRLLEQSADQRFLGDLLTDEGLPEQHRKHSDLKAVLRAISKTLSDRERFILLERCGLGPSKRPRTLQCLSEEMGISKERVRQLHHQAIGKIRKHIDQP